jgi:hypothetical protein
MKPYAIRRLRPSALAALIGLPGIVVVVVVLDFDVLSPRLPRRHVSAPQLRAAAPGADRTRLSAAVEGIGGVPLRSG